MLSSSNSYSSFIFSKADNVNNTLVDMQVPYLCLYFILYLYFTFMLSSSYSDFSFIFSKTDNVNYTPVDKLMPGLCSEGKALGPSCVNQLLSKRWRSENMKAARTFVKLFIFCRAMCAKRCWQMHKGGDIKLCQICVCSLCHSCNLRKLTKLCQIKRRPRQRNSKLYNLKQFSSLGKTQFCALAM